MAKARSRSSAISVSKLTRNKNLAIIGALNKSEDEVSVKLDFGHFTGFESILGGVCVKKVV